MKAIFFLQWLRVVYHQLYTRFSALDTSLIYGVFCVAFLSLKSLFFLLSTFTICMYYLPGMYSYICFFYQYLKSAGGEDNENITDVMMVQIYSFVLLVRVFYYSFFCNFMCSEKLL